MQVPENMKILHDEEFEVDLLNGYADETYFRLKHDLRKIRKVVLPDGFSAGMATAEEFAEHISICYQDIGTSAQALREAMKRPVYCPELWLAVRDDAGKIAASGIGEVDRMMGEGTLEWIQVSLEYRGLGLGSYVVTELLRRMKPVVRFATVSGRCGNPTNPERLYRSCGFTGNDIWHILREK